MKTRAATRQTNRRIGADRLGALMWGGGLALALIVDPGVAASGAAASDDEKTVTAEEVRQETEEAASKAAAYVKQQRQEAEAVLADEVEQWNQWLETTRKEAAARGEAVRARMDEELAKLQDEIEAARGKLNELRAAGEEDWQAVKAELDAVAADVREHWTRLKNRLAPEESSGSSS